jgi:hypothetical protein
MINGVDGPPQDVVRVVSKELNMAIRRYVSISLTASILAASGMMIEPAHVAEFWGRSIARTSIPDSPPLPCSKQSWWNADRVCLSWATPRGPVR